MKNLRLFLILAAIASFCGCASTVIESRRFKSYEIGATKSANVGTAFFVNQDGEVKKMKHWVGLLNSPDGWAITEVYSQDFIRQELVYAGKSGDTIKVAYKEFRQNLAAPAFFQSLEYDLSQSKTIRFQRFTIEVLEATNESIKYRVVSDTGSSTNEGKAEQDAGPADKLPLASEHL